MATALLLAVSGPAQTPHRPPSSCLAPASWVKLAATQMSKRREVNSTALSLDGRVLVVTIRDGVLSRIVAFDAQSAAKLWDEALDDPADLATVAMDGSQVAARTGVRCPGVPLRHWDLQTGKPLAPLAQEGSFAGQIWPAAIALGGNAIAAAAAMTGDLQIWQTATGKTVRSVDGNFPGLIPHQGLASLQLNRAGDLLVAGGAGTILRWAVPAMKPGAAVPVFGTMPIGRLLLSADGKLMAAGARGGTALIDVSTGKALRTLAESWQPLLFLANGSILVASETQTGIWKDGDLNAITKLPPGPHRLLATGDGSVFDAVPDGAAQLRLVSVRGPGKTPRLYSLPGR